MAARLYGASAVRPTRRGEVRSADLGGGRPRAEVGDGLVSVVEAQARVDGDGSRHGGPCGGWDERPGVGAVAGCVDAVDGRRLARVDRDGAVVAQLAAQRARDVGAYLPADEEEQRVPVERLAVAEMDATQAPGVVAVQRDDRRLHDRDADGLQPRELAGGELVRAVAEQDDVVRPLAQHDGEVLAPLAGGQDGETLVAVLEAVA